jgi:hypothetical protein
VATLVAIRVVGVVAHYIPPYGVILGIDRSH